MWEKATKLYTSPGAIQCAPYCEENTPVTPVYLVLSGSNSRKFHESAVAHSQQLSNVRVRG